MAVNTGLYLDEDLFAFAKEQAAAAHRGKVNAYVVDLIKRDRAAQGQSAANLVSPEPLVELARKFHPTIAEDIKASLDKAKVNQPRAVARLIEAAQEAVERKVDLTAHIKIVTSLEEAPIMTILQEIKDAWQTAAEHPGAYGGPIPNSPAKEVIEQHKAGQAAKAATAPNPSRKPKGPSAKPARGA